MREVQLSSDDTAQVREVDDIIRGDARIVYKLADKDGAVAVNGQLGMDTMGALQDAVVVQFTHSWTLTDSDGKSLPITMKTIKGLGLRQFNALATALAPVLTEIGGQQQDATPDPTSAANSSTSDDTASTDE